MRELLAGPITLSALDPLGTVPRADTCNSVWVDGWGLVFRHINWYVLKTNGKLVNVSSSDRSLSGLVAESKLLAVMGTDDWTSTHFPAFDEVEQHDLSVVAGHSFGVMPDRIIYPDGADIRSMGLDGSGDDVEFTMPAFGFPTAAQLAYAGQEDGSHLWWHLNPVDGLACCYDATLGLERTDKRTSLGGAFRTAGYCWRLGLWVVLRTNGGDTAEELFLYGDQPKADHLVLTSATPKAKGRQLVTAQVLGDQDEPCSGRHVAFSATAGSFDPAVVTTDSEGYALSWFTAPASGSTTITASLTE